MTLQRGCPRRRGDRGAGERADAGLEDMLDRGDASRGAAQGCARCRRRRRRAAGCRGATDDRQRPSCSPSPSKIGTCTRRRGGRAASAHGWCRGLRQRCRPRRRVHRAGAALSATMISAPRFSGKCRRGPGPRPDLRPGPPRRAAGAWIMGDQQLRHAAAPCSRTIDDRSFPCDYTVRMRARICATRFALLPSRHIPRSRATAPFACWCSAAVRVGAPSPISCLRRSR